MKRVFNMDWTESKDQSWDNQWKSAIEVVWNSGVPFLSGAFAILFHPLWCLGFIIAAFFTIKIERKR